MKETCFKSSEHWPYCAYHIQTVQMPGFAFYLHMKAKDRHRQFQDRPNGKLQNSKNKQGQIFSLYLYCQGEQQTPSCMWVSGSDAIYFKHYTYYEGIIMEQIACIKRLVSKSDV